MGLGKSGAAVASRPRPRPRWSAPPRSCRRRSGTPFERTNHAASRSRCWRARSRCSARWPVLAGTAGPRRGAGGCDRWRARSPVRSGRTTTCAGTTPGQGFPRPPERVEARRGDQRCGEDPRRRCCRTGRRRAAAASSRKGVGAVAEVVADGALIAGTANLTNLLDLRPGRALKAVTGDERAGVPGERPCRGGRRRCRSLRRRRTSASARCSATAAPTASAPSPVRRWPLRCRARCKVLVLGAVVALNLASEKVSFTKVIAEKPTLDKIDQWGRRPR